MKKLLAILLALCMVISLAACGSDSKDDDDKKDKDEVVEEAENNEDDEDDKDDKEDKDDKNDKDDKKDKDDKEDKDDKNDKPGKGGKAESASDLTRGTIDGDVYKNDSLDIEFEKPSSWSYLSDDQLSAMLNISGTFDSDLEDLLDEFGAFFDMSAMDLTTGESIIVFVENPDAYIGINSDQDYLDSVISSREATGTVSLDGEYEDIELGSNTYKKACLVGDNMVQAYYVDYVNDYLICIIVTVVEQDLSDVEAKFS